MKNLELRIKRVVTLALLCIGGFIAGSLIVTVLSLAITGA